VSEACRRQSDELAEARDRADDLVDHLVAGIFAGNDNGFLGERRDFAMPRPSAISCWPRPMMPPPPMALIKPPSRPLLSPAPLKRATRSLAPGIDSIILATGPSSASRCRKPSIMPSAFSATSGSRPTLSAIRETSSFMLFSCRFLTLTST